MHDLHVSASEDPLNNELHGESSESVFVGNHNSPDFSALDSFQKGLEAAAAVPVDAGADVRDEFCGWVLGSEVADLSFEVSSLVFAGDSSGDDVRFRLLLVVVAEDAVEVGAAVQTLSSRQAFEHTRLDLRWPNAGRSAGRLHNAKSPQQV